ncbi:MAG: UDP-3-O-acyl-N-acetylglucosamine deacetylase [Candidatus Goldiibacteriota bacterium]
MREKQITIAGSALVKGRGLHKGRESTVVFSAAAPGRGIIIKNNNEKYTLRPENVFDTRRGTSVKKGKSRIYTVEHMVSAVRGLGIDNITVEIKGGELPCGDGSAAVFAKAVLSAGLKKQNALKKTLEIKEPAAVKDNGCFLAVIPYPVFKVYYFSDFSEMGCGPMEFSSEVTPDTYLKRICRARTFGFKKELQGLIKSGLIKGAGPKNAVLMDKGRAVNTRLRYKNELARHKALDVIGDFGILGSGLKMLVIAYKTGHRHNIEAIKKIRTIKK